MHRSQQAAIIPSLSLHQVSLSRDFCITHWADWLHEQKIISRHMRQKRLSPEQCACLYDVLQSAGEVFTWGQGSEGQLGHGQAAFPRNRDEFLPRSIASISSHTGTRVSSVCAGHSHCGAPSSDDLLAHVCLDAAACGPPMPDQQDNDWLSLVVSSLCRRFLCISTCSPTSSPPLLSQQQRFADRNHQFLRTQS